MKRAGNLLLVVLIVCSLACLTNVSAFGITSPYWQERPLEVVPGETVDVYLELQNMLGEEDITVVAEVVKGSEIVEIVDESNEYFVPFGSKDVKISLRITIPENAAVGTEYEAGITVTTITPGEKGAVSMGSSIEKDFPIIVKSATTEATATGTNWGLVLGVIVVIVIVILIVVQLLKGKKSKVKKK